MLTRTGRVAINTLSNYIRFGTIFIVFLLMTPVMMQGFGTQEYGIWTLVFSVTGFLGLFDLGFGTASVKFIAQLSGSGELEQRSRLTGTLMTVYLALAVLSGLAALAISPFLDGILGLSGGQAEKARFLYWILVFRSAVLYLPLSLFRHILFGKQKIWLVNAIQVVSTAVYGIGTVLVIRAGGGIIAVAWVNLAAMVLEHILYAIPVLAMKDRPRILPNVASRGEFKDISSVSMYSFLVNLIVLVQMRTDPFIINALVADPLRAVAIYSVATKIGEYYLLMVKQFGNSISPLVAELKGKGEEGKIRFLLTAGTKYAFLPATLLGVFLVAAARPLILAWVGPEYAQAALPLIVTVCVVMLTVPEMIASTILTMTGHHRMNGRAAVLAMILNVGFSIAFVSMLGIVGAALGTLVACLIVDIGIIMPKALKLYRIRIPDYLYRLLPSVIVPGLSDLAITRLIMNLTHPARLPALALAAIPGAMVCLALFWFVFVDSTERELFVRAFRRAGKQAESDRDDRDTVAMSMLWLRSEEQWLAFRESGSQGVEDHAGTSDDSVLDPFASRSYQHAVWKNILGKPPAIRFGFRVSSRDISIGAEESSVAPAADGAYFAVCEETRKFGTMRIVRTMDYHATGLDLFPQGRKAGFSAWDSLLDARGEIGFETGASLMSLYKLTDESASALEQRLSTRKIPYSKQVFNKNFHILLPDDIEVYWKTKSSKALYNIRRSERLLSAETGKPLRTVRYSSAELEESPGAAVFGAFLVLLLRWAENRAEGSADLPPSEILSFRQDAFSGWIRDDAMELYVLLSGNEVLAGQINVFRSDRIVVNAMSYDQDYARFSPGRILFRNFLTLSHERGIRLIELGGEGEDWKKEWSTHDEPVWSVSFPIGGWKDALWSLSRSLKSLRPRRRGPSGVTTEPAGVDSAKAEAGAGEGSSSGPDIRNGA